ncbi:MAG: DUF1566 domain-containing protein [Myxococcota bacterium]|nr:DUF1566 domain-containing protein [Myxococcota bacterium]
MTGARQRGSRASVGVAAGFIVVATLAVLASLDGAATAQVDPGQESAEEQHECPAGQVWRNGRCRERATRPRCPEGQHREGSSCVWDPCPTGQRREGGRCVSPPAVPAGGLAACDGGRYDAASRLCWQDPPPEQRYTWQQAIDYCAGLSLGGHGAGEWRLPTIAELRSLIRGCARTQAGGSCPVGDSCLGSGCWTSEACTSCESLRGPGTGGCYWPAGLGGACSGYWSSSSSAGSASDAWPVNFHYGYVYNHVKANTYYVRCVRRGP